MIKKWKSVVVTIWTIVLCFSMIVPVSAESVKFADVSADHWAYSSIMTMTEQKYVGGYPDGTTERHY